jgi:hypothetical protein
MNSIGLITPDSWKSYPVVIKNAPAKKRATATVNQPTKTEEESKPIVEQSSIPKKPRTEKPKRDTSLFSSFYRSVIFLFSGASKPTTTEQTPATKPPKRMCFFSKSSLVDFLYYISGKNERRKRQNSKIYSRKTTRT